MQDMKTVPLELGGKTRHLRYDANALIDLGESLDINLLTPEGWEKLVGKKEKNSETGEETFVPVEPTFRTIRAIVWAGLRHEDESLTERQVGAMMDPANMGAVIDAYQEAWKAQDVTTPANEAPLAEAAGSGAAQS
jgi:hypothetical protein